MLITLQPGPRQPEISRTPYRKLVLLRTPRIPHHHSPPHTSPHLTTHTDLSYPLSGWQNFKSRILSLWKNGKLLLNIWFMVYWNSLNRTENNLHRISGGINKSECSPSWTRSPKDPTICYLVDVLGQSLICFGTKSCWITK